MLISGHSHHQPIYRDVATKSINSHQPHAPAAIRRMWRKKSTNSHEHQTMWRSCAISQQSICFSTNPQRHPAHHQQKVWHCVKMCFYVCQPSNTWRGTPTPAGMCALKLAHCQRAAMRRRQVSAKTQGSKTIVALLPKHPKRNPRTPLSRSHGVCVDDGSCQLDICLWSVLSINRHFLHLVQHI